MFRFGNVNQVNLVVLGRRIRGSPISSRIADNGVVLLLKIMEGDLFMGVSGLPIITFGYIG